MKAPTKNSSKKDNPPPPPPPLPTHTQHTHTNMHSQHTTHIIHPHAVCTPLATCGRSGKPRIYAAFSSCMLFDGYEDLDDRRTACRTGTETSEAACVSGMHGSLHHFSSCTALILRDSPPTPVDDLLLEMAVLHTLIPVLGYSTSPQDSQNKVVSAIFLPISCSTGIYRGTL